MEAQLRLTPSVALSDHWQRAPSLDRETQALFARARGRVLHVAFAERPRALASLVFRNFYAASLRLVQLNTDGSTLVLLDEYPLMRHTHCEDDAQQWHLIHLDQLRTKPDLARLDSLLFYLFQPSPIFETWDLQHLTLYESRAKDMGDPEAVGVPTANSGLASKNDAVPAPSMHQLMRRLSRSSMLVVDARDVRENASQILSRVHELRRLLHQNEPTTP